MTQRKEFIFVDCGVVDDTRYVDVVGAHGEDPIQYAIPVEEATREYGASPVMTMAELAEHF